MSIDRLKKGFRAVRKLFRRNEQRRGGRKPYQTSKPIRLGNIWYIPVRNSKGQIVKLKKLRNVLMGYESRQRVIERRMSKRAIRRVAGKIPLLGEGVSEAGFLYEAAKDARELYEMSKKKKKLAKYT